jgi:hypothetical protein
MPKILVHKSGKPVTFSMDWVAFKDKDGWVEMDVTQQTFDEIPFSLPYSNWVLFLDNIGDEWFLATVGGIDTIGDQYHTFSITPSTVEELKSIQEAVALLS